MTAYSDGKVLWDIDRLKRLRLTGRTVPTQIQLVVSDFCNHDCSFCAYRMSGYTSNTNFGIIEGGKTNNNPRRFIPVGKALQIIDDAAFLGVEAIQFTGGGEPTVHPQFLDILEHAIKCDLKVSLVTNGSIPPSPRLLDLVPKMAWIRVSLDAGSAQTYSEIRRIPEWQFARTCAHLGILARTARPTDCTLGVSYIVTKENDRLADLMSAAEIACSRGAKYIRFAAIFTPELADYYPDMMATMGRLSRVMERYDNDSFSVIDMFAQRGKDLIQGPPDYEKCGYQHLNMYIGGDQKVYRCCNTAYSPAGLVGDLSNQSLRDFFCSKATDEAYANFDARSCEHCAFNGKNRLINLVTGPPPKHWEFA